MKRILSGGLLLCMLLLTACGLAEPAMQDRAGNPIALPKTVQRVVSLVPAATQVIEDLGRMDAVVAVDTYTAAAKDVGENIMAFDMMAPDVEQIIAHAPDVVLVSGMSLVTGDDPLAALSDLGICVAYIPTSDSIEGIRLDVLFVGEIMGDAQGAQALVDSLDEAIEVHAATREEPLSVYFEVDPGLYSFGTGTFLNEMIALLGGENIFADQQGWIAASEEAIVAAAPDVIFTIAPSADAASDILSRSGWETIPAVANGRVFKIDADSASQPNHRIQHALEEMAKAMQ